MKELHELKERLMDYLLDYGKKDMSSTNLEVIDKLTHTIKNLCKIIEDEGYSGNYPYAYSDGRDGRSYKRDSMGRYSRSSLKDKLHELMDEAPDDRTRMEIKRLFDRM